MSAQPTVQQTESSLTVENGIVQVAYVFNDAPTLMNKALGLHRRPRSELTREWRSLFADLAAGTPPMLHCDVVIRHEHRRGGRNIPDCAATAFTVKAAIDGIVDAGVLPDDGPKHLRSIRFDAPQHTHRDALHVMLRGPAA